MNSERRSHKPATSNAPSSAGDEDGEAQEADAALLKLQASPAKAERSHLIVWQVLLSGE